MTFVLPHHGMVWISATPQLTFEKNLFYAAGAVTLLLTGPGAYSIDWLEVVLHLRSVVFEVEWNRGLYAIGIPITQR
jgi:hypothetical protein